MLPCFLLQSTETPPVPHESEFSLHLQYHRNEEPCWSRTCVFIPQTFLFCWGQLCAKPRRRALEVAEKLPPGVAAGVCWGRHSTWLKVDIGASHSAVWETLLRGETEKQTKGRNALWLFSLQELGAQRSLTSTLVTHHRKWFHVLVGRGSAVRMTFCAGCQN